MARREGKGGVVEGRRDAIANLLRHPSAAGVGAMVMVKCGSWQRRNRQLIEIEVRAAVSVKERQPQQVSIAAATRPRVSSECVAAASSG